MGESNVGRPVEGGMQSVQSPEEQKKPEAREEEAQKKTFYLGSLLFDAKIICNRDGSITFTEDIYLEKEASTLMSTDEIMPLIQAGILDKETSWYDSDKSGYELAEYGFGGWVHIKKEDINNALRDGRIKATLGEDGVVQIHT